MSGLLAKTQRKEGMPDSRKARINELLRILKTQRFFPGSDAAANKDPASQPYPILFDTAPMRSRPIANGCPGCWNWPRRW